MAGSINDAARAAADPQVMVRPNPVQWIWYAFGGRLRPIHGGWVLHDVTCRTRWLRQAVRAVVQVAVPAVVVWAVLSGLGFGLVALGGIAGVRGANVAATSRDAVRSFDRLAWQMHDDLLTDVTFEQFARFCAHTTPSRDSTLVPERPLAAGP